MLKKLQVMQCVGITEKNWFIMCAGRTETYRMNLA